MAVVILHICTFFNTVFGSKHRKYKKDVHILVQADSALWYDLDLETLENAKFYRDQLIGFSETPLSE